jgi:choline dehydrogenase-like flavoprotein
MDSTGAGVTGFFPQLLDHVPHNGDGVGGAHIYIPWWLERERTGFLRGYHMEVWGGRGMPGYGALNGVQHLNGQMAGVNGKARSKGGGGFGLQLKEDYRKLYGAVIGLEGRGEMIARRENHCAIDPDVVDKYGIPVLRFDVRWSDQEVQQVKHFHETAREIIHAMGGTSVGDMPGADERYGITTPGRIIHEVGVTRMGTDPKTSSLNPNCQAHDVDNLFVSDAGPFVSQPHKNPTWTIMALAMRTSEFVVEELSRRNL